MSQSTTKSNQNANSEFDLLDDQLVSSSISLNDFHLTDLLNLEDIRELFELQFAFAQLPVGLLDLDNNIIFGIGWQEICLKFHRENPETVKLCHVSDSYIMNHLREGKYAGYKCKLGLWDFAIPIIVAGKHMANLFFGQFLYEEDEEDIHYFEKQAKLFGFDQQEYLTALNKVPRLKRERVQQIMAYYAKLVDIITDQAFKNLKLQLEIRRRENVENTLSKSQLEYEILLQNIPQRVFYKNKELSYVVCNKSFADSLGLSPAQISGKSDFDLFSVKLAEKYRNDDFRIIKNGQPEFFEEIFESSGQQRYVNTMKLPVKDENDQTIGLYGIFWDVTEEHNRSIELKEKTDFLESIYNGAETPIFVIRIDDNGQFLFEGVNPAYERLSQRQAEELKDTSPLEQAGLSPEAKKNITEQYQLCIDQGKVVQFREMISVEGQDVYWLTTLTPLKREDESVYRIVGTAINIQELIAAQQALEAHKKELEQNVAERTQALKENEERYELATAAANLGVWDWDVPNNEVYYSDIWKAQIGYKPDELKDDFSTWIDHLHPDDRDRCLAAVDKYINKPRGKFILDFRFRHKKGHYVWIHNEAASQLDNQGRVMRVFGAHIDMTRQKIAEAEIRESEEKYKTLTESSKDQIFIISTDFRVVFVNGEAAKAFNQKPNKINGKHLSELFPDQEANRQIAEVKAVIEKGKTKSTIAVSSFQGKEVWLDTTWVPIKNEQGVVTSVMGVSRNVTESKRKEKAIIESEERFRSLTNATAQIVWMTNANGEIEKFQPAWASYTGHGFSQMEGKGYLSAVHPDDLEATGEAWNTALANKSHYVFEHRLRRKDGAYRYFEVRGVPILDTQGNIKEWIGTYTDVHDKKLATKALVESEERLSRAIEDAPFPIMIHAQGGEVLQISKTWTELTGYDFSDIPTIDAWLTKAYGMNSSLVKEHLNTVYHLSEKTHDGEFEITCKDGSKVIWDFSTSPIGLLSDGRKIVISMANDITSRKRAVELLKRSESSMKMILDSMPFGAIIIGENKVIKSVNNAAIKMMGYKSANDIIGKRCHETMCPAEEGRCPILDFHLPMEQSDRILITKDRKKVPILKSVIPITLGDERVLLETFVDISEKKLLEEKLLNERNKLLAILDGIQDVIYVADPDTYELVHVNDVLRKSWGQNVLGKKCYKVLQNRNTPCPFCTNDKIFGENYGETYVWEFQNELTKNWYRCSDRAITWHDGRKLRFELASDITPLKTAEQEKSAALINLTERMKEIRCLYHINELLRNKNLPVAKVIAEIVKFIPEGWHFPEQTKAYFVFDDIIEKSSNYKPSGNYIREDISIEGISRGYLRVDVEALKPEDPAPPFLDEEIKLLQEIIFTFERYINELEYEVALANSEKQFRSLVNNSPLPIVITDADSNIEFTNIAFQSVIGYTLSEIPDVDHWWPLAYPDIAYREQMKARWGEAMQKAIDKKVASEPIEAEVCCKNGEKRIFSVIGTEIGTKVLVLFVDLTERIQAEEERDRFFRVSLDLLCIAGTDGYFKRINPAWSELLGYTEQELLSRPFLDFVHPDDIQPTLMEVEKLANGEPTISFINRYRCANGEYKFLSWKTTPHGDMLYAAANDITELKHSEEKLKNIAVELKRSNQELEQFAYVASHDLQEPLRMVSSFTQLLEKRYKDKIDDQANTYISFAVDGANRMQKLINDLLDFSRITTRGKDFEPVDANSEIKLVLTGMKLAVEEANAQVTFDKLPSIMADKSQFGRLLQNLIGNAIKFTRPGIPPQVHISASDKDDSWLFSVKDNGIGIDQEFKDKIFVIFQRLHAKSAYKGTGIGLAVCKRIVERHGGTIWFESIPGQGTKFLFTIKKKFKNNN